MSFSKKVSTTIYSRKSTLCIGIDPNIDLIPEPLKRAYTNIDDLFFHFGKNIIDETNDIAICYKLQIAYFSAVGAEDVLVDLIRYIKEKGMLAIVDAKRGDISDTAEKYACELFSRYDADATTLSPYMGMDTLLPYMSDEYRERGKFILCKTSNPGSFDFQNLLIDGKPLYKIVAERVLAMNDENLALVVASTHSDEFCELRTMTDRLFLVPGIGKQGGSVDNLRLAGSFNRNIINVGRSIIYADNIREAAIKYSKMCQI